jgi:intracellular septation protein A
MIKTIIYLLFAFIVLRSQKLTKEEINERVIELEIKLNKIKWRNDLWMKK